MDIREQLARDLLSAPYSELSQQKKSVIDLIADQKPTGLGPLAKIDERDAWARLADKVAQVGRILGLHHLLHCRADDLGHRKRLPGCKGVRPRPLHFPQPDALDGCRPPGAGHQMMSQNRQGAIDRAAAEHDYVVNMRESWRSCCCTYKLDALRERDILARTDAIAAQLKQLCDDVAILKARS